MQTYDLIVIGSGPAGQRAAIQGAKSGRRVVVVEQRQIVGGACVNTGTIPSKTMREAVMHLSGYEYQGIYGINYHVKDKITMADLGFRVNQVIKTEVDVTQAQLARNGVEVIYARASFLDATHIRVENARGQSDLEATAHLSAINAIGNLPWAVTFSYGRALQAAPQAAWSGKAENIAAGQAAFAHRAVMNSLAATGKWNEADEKKAA